MKKELDNYLVTKYPKIFVNRYGDMKETSMMFGFQNNDGWFWLIDQLCDSIQSYIDNHNSYCKEENKIQQLVATSVKEKFGILSFNYYNGDNHIDGMVRIAENMSMNICEFCGSNHNVGRTNGWIYTVCYNCHSNGDERVKSLPWKLNYECAILLTPIELRKIILYMVNKIL